MVDILDIFYKSQCIILLRGRSILFCCYFVFFLYNPLTYIASLKKKTDTHTVTQINIFCVPLPVPFFFDEDIFELRERCLSETFNS